MIPSDADLKKKKANLEGFLKKIDRNTGKSREASMIATVRSAIRKAWLRSPTKLAYLTMNTVADTDPNTRTKWKIQCECCKGWNKLGDVEVDHIEGWHTFTKLSEFTNYFNKILMVGFDDLQILCKECHAAKTLSEKLGISFEDALTEKQVIAIIKEKRDKTWLSDRGITPESNSDKRKIQIRDYLKSNK